MNALAVRDGVVLTTSNNFTTGDKNDHPVEKSKKELAVIALVAAQRFGKKVGQQS